MTDDPRRFAPAAARNRDVILKVLSAHLPARGHVLEIASGSGEHVTHFAKAHPNLTFQPSDLDPECHASIDAWTKHEGLTNVAPALTLDMTQELSLPNPVDVVVCMNMIHISPWAATLGLIKNAARLLPAGGVLFLYGPYQRHGAHTAPSNEAFDADLKSRNSEWGIRDLETIITLASEHGFATPTIEPMPANNFSVIFKRA